MFKFIRKIFTTFIVIAFLAIGLIGYGFYGSIFKWTSNVPARITIESGFSVSDIAKLLEQHGVIKTPMIFSVYARVRGYAGKLKAGEYEFPKNIKLDQVLQKLVKGDVLDYQIQIIEGWNINDIAKSMLNNPAIKENVVNDFSVLVKDKNFINEFGLGNLNSLEGYLFPDTYNIVKPITAEKLIKQFIQRFNEVYTNDLNIKAAGAGFSRNEVITLASIIEKETGAKEERPVIASVFLNRLKKGMALQSDPTIIYGLKNFDGNLRKKDLTNPHLYNTYVHAGLPPGPICSPGVDSIKAVLFPATTKYLYFVSKNDGTHHFSTSLIEHNNAVRKYQLNGR